MKNSNNPNFSHNSDNDTILPQNEKVKLLMVGDSTAGKSSLLQQFVEGSFNVSFITTIGIDYKIKMMNYGTLKKKVIIWDTAGQERFRTITRSYFRGSEGVFLVFDVTNRKSFDNIHKWILDIKSIDNDPLIMLVGNKCDLNDLRIVSFEEAEKKACEHGFPYFETSAKTGYNVNLIYQNMFDSICRKNMLRSSIPIKSSSIVEIKPNTDNNKSCCQ